VLAAADVVPAVATEEYQEVLDRLSSLIKQKVRTHSGNHWDLMAHYLKVPPLLPSFP
jgi:hypothetical protein